MGALLRVQVKIYLDEIYLDIANHKYRVAKFFVAGGPEEFPQGQETFRPNPAKENR
jgi:hypothetical protein